MCPKTPRLGRSPPSTLASATAGHITNPGTEQPQQESPRDRPRPDRPRRSRTPRAQQPLRRPRTTRRDLATPSRLNARDRHARVGRIARQTALALATTPRAPQPHLTASDQQRKRSGLNVRRTPSRPPPNPSSSLPRWSLLPPQSNKPPGNTSFSSYRLPRPYQRCRPHRRLHVHDSHRQQRRVVYTEE